MKEEREKEECERENKSEGKVSMRNNAETTGGRQTNSPLTLNIKLSVVETKPLEPTHSYVP